MDGILRLPTLSYGRGSTRLVGSPELTLKVLGGSLPDLPP